MFSFDMKCSGLCGALPCEVSGGQEERSSGGWTVDWSHHTLHSPPSSPPVSLPVTPHRRAMSLYGVFYSHSSREFQFFIVILKEEGVRIQIKFNLLWPWHVQLRLRICYFIFLGTLYSNLTLSMSLEFTWLCRSWNQESYWLWMIIATFIIQIRTTSLGLPGQ